jgi:hypothetical protein
MNSHTTITYPHRHHTSSPLGLLLSSSSETSHCSMSAPHVKIVPLLDVHQLLMLFARTLTYSEPGTFSSLVFYNMLLLLLLLLLLLSGCCVSTQISKNWVIVIIVINMYVCMYVYCPFSPHNSKTIGNVLILFFSPANANFNISWNYY